jgi:integrase/recombinase XerD
MTNEKLKKVLVEYLESKKDRDGNLDLDRPLIESQKRGSFSPNTLQQLIHRLYKCVGIDASSHSGRRTYATRQADRGVSIRNLQVLLGHSSISSTALYIQESPKVLSKISVEYSI